MVFWGSKMANYLFLRGNRNKRFFIDIADELKKDGHNCFLIKFELGELLFKSDIHSIFAPSHVTKEEYPISDEELLSLEIYNITFKDRILNKKVTVKELKIYKKYMFFIDQFIESNNIDVICLFNGYHWIDQVTKYIAKKRGLQVFHFEDGFFRPYTVTCDSKGINAESSVPRDPEHYKELTVDRDRLKNHLYKPEDATLLSAGKENLLMVAFVKLFSMLGSLLGIHPSYYAHITLWQAIKYFFHKKMYRYREPDSLQLPDEYFFVPFQVSRDTQIFYNSPHISNMEDFLDIVYEATREVNKRENRNIHVIVKEHPEDMSRNNYWALKKKYEHVQEVTFVQKYDIKKIIRNSLAVVTINSTVGLEALSMRKKVVTLGDALYNIEGVSYHCDHPDKLQDVLVHALNSKNDPDLIEKFIYYLRFSYQVEGTINSPNKVTAKNIAQRISI